LIIAIQIDGPQLFRCTIAKPNIHALVNLCKIYSVIPGKYFLLHPKFKIYSKPLDLHLVAYTYSDVSSNLLWCDGCSATPHRPTPCHDAALQ
jgi:hypothetical protein